MSGLDSETAIEAVIAAVVHHGHEFSDFCLGLTATESTEITRPQKLAVRCALHLLDSEIPAMRSACVSRDEIREALARRWGVECRSSYAIPANHKLFLLFGIAF